MSLFDKKFKELLDASPDHAALKERAVALEERVVSLERQVVTIGQALNDTLRSYIDLARVTADNRLTLEELMNLMSPEGNDLANADDAEPSVEELTALKKTLN